MSINPIAWNPQIITPDFDIRGGNFSFVGFGVQQFLDANPNRVALVLQNAGGSGIAYNWIAFALMTEGFNFPINQPPIQFAYQNIGALIGYPMFGMSLGGATNFVWQEVIYVPRR